MPEMANPPAFDPSAGQRPRPPHRGPGLARRKLGALAAATVALTAASVAGPLTGVGEAGGHIDAPSSLLDSATDITDVYAFTSPEDTGTVTLIANVRPFQLPGTAANALVDHPFATGARYEIHTDADGDGAPDATYRWTFRNEDRRPFGTGPKVGPLPVNSLDDRSLGVRQKYTLEKVTADGTVTTLLRDAVAAPTHTGRTLMPNYGKLRTQAIRNLPGGGRTVATQAAESFKADTQVFGLFVAGTSGPVPGWLPDAQPLSALNVNSLVLQVPKSEVALAGDARRNPVVGVWSSVSRQGADLGQSLAGQAPPTGRSPATAPRTSPSPSTGRPSGSRSRAGRRTASRHAPPRTTTWTPTSWRRRSTPYRRSASSAPRAARPRRLRGATSRPCS